MRSRPPVAIGSAVYVAGLTGALALLTGRPRNAVLAVAAGGVCLGLLAGGLIVSSDGLAGLLAGRAGSAALGLVLLSVGLWATVTGLLSGVGVRYYLTMGSVFLAVVGWAIIAGGSQRAGEEWTDTLVTLPKTEPSGVVDTDGRRRLLGMVGTGVTVAVVGYFGWRAVALGDLYSGLFAGLFFAVFLPGTKQRVRLTEAGVVTTRYLLWLVPIRRSRTAWVEIYGYEATDERLRIASNVGPDIVYNPDRTAELDRIVGILDDHVPQL